MKYLECKTPEFNLKLEAFGLRLKQERKKESSKNSFVNYAKEFLMFIEESGIDSIEKISQESIDNFSYYLREVRKNKKTGLPIAGAYINKFREAVLRFVEFYTESQVGCGPFELRNIKTVMTEKEVLSKEEIQALFNACDNTWSGLTDKCLLALMYGCGMRKGEVHTLEVNDIDFTKGLIRLDRTKTKQDRDVVMPPNVQQIIEEYYYTARGMMLPTDSDETFFIVTEQGMRMSLNTIPWRINKMAERAEIGRKISPHLFRHSIATHLLEHLTLEEVAHFLGHKCLDSTQIYTHYLNQNL